MAKFNYFWKRAALVSLVLCLCLAIVACGGKNDGNGETSETTTQPTTVGNSIYTISVDTISGVALKGVSVYVYTDSTMSELETMKPLAEDGTITFEALTSDKYVVVLMGVPAGYNVQEYYAVTGLKTEILLTPGVITNQEKPEGKIYKLGDIVYDFTITDSTGTEHTLSQLLQEKDAVVLNFWYLNCTPCKLEFPYLEMAYQEFSDRIEVLGINCEDGSDAELNVFASEYELTFPLAIGEKDYWYPAAYTACPTTIVIDRYGTIVYMHTGYFDEVAPFIALFRTITSEEYEQVLIEDIENIITEEDQRPDGTAERPFEMGGATEFDVKVPANGEVHYNLYRLFNVTMRIENPNAYVIVEGQEYYPVDGVIELQVSCEDTMKPLNVVFGNTGNTKNTIHVKFVFEPGNVNNPIALVLGDNEIFISDVNGLGKYYTYTATATGTLTIAVQGITEQAVANIQLYNENTYEAVYDSVVDPETGWITYAIHVNEGDHVQLIIGAGVVDPEIVLESVTIQALASLVEDGGSGVIDGRVDYSLTVVDQDGKPVSGARFQLSSAGQNATLITDETGRIHIRLKENAYFLEMALPSGYVADSASYMWSPVIKDLIIQVSTTATYTVQVQTALGEALENITVRIYGEESCENLLYAIVTGENGMVSFIGKSGMTYYMTLSGVAENLEVQEKYVTEGETTVVTLSEAVSTPDDKLGDVIEELMITDLDGNTYSLQELLQQKKMVILTFWRIGSQECNQNLLALQELYEIYGDSIAILALNAVDMQDTELRIYKAMYGLTFPVAKCDRTLLEELNAVTFPTTIVIDRESKVCLHHSEVMTQEDGEAVIQFFTAEDYSHMHFKTLQALLEHIAQNPGTEDPQPTDPENPDVEDPQPTDPENPDVEDPQLPEEPEDPVANCT